MPRTYKESNARFRALGVTLGTSLATAFKNDPYVQINTDWTDVVESGMGDLLKEYSYSKLKAQAIFTDALERQDMESFSERYRAAWPGADEHFATAAVRELLSGFAEGIHAVPLPAGMLKTVVDVAARLFSAISMLRMPTRDTGFNYAAEPFRMQHKTSDEGGMFGESAGSGSTHNDLDRQRRDFVDQTMRDYFQALDDVSQTLKEGVKAAIRFSVKKFVAPATASDQKPIGPWSQQEKEAQASLRDVVKDTGVALGLPQGPRDPTIDNLIREWGHQQLTDPLSPSRGEDDEAEEDSMLEPATPLGGDPMTDVRVGPLAAAASPAWTPSQLLPVPPGSTWTSPQLLPVQPTQQLTPEWLPGRFQPDGYVEIPQAEPAQWGWSSLPRWTWSEQSSADAGIDPAPSAPPLDAEPYPPESPSAPSLYDDDLDFDWAYTSAGDAVSFPQAATADAFDLDALLQWPSAPPLDDIGSTPGAAADPFDELMAEAPSIPTATEGAEASEAMEIVLEAAL